ncbi:MAG: hypothetical protein Q8S27_07165, partial [Hoeflea sp.]|nr:hypothetical protein [Hoeflea sp.]
LNALYAPNRHTIPETTSLSDPLTKQERDWVAEFSGDPSRRHLEQASYKKLIASYSTPPQHNAIQTRYVNSTVETHGDWISYRSPDGDCRMTSTAATTQGLYIRPYMLVMVDPSWPSGDFAVSMLLPNTFRAENPSWLRIDGYGYGLQSAAGHLQPMDSEWDDVLRALGKASLLEVEGVDKYSQTAMKIRFSASGFTGAFRRMAALCDRSDAMERRLGIDPAGNQNRISAQLSPSAVLRNGPPDVAPDRCLLVVGARQSITDVHGFVAQMPDERERDKARVFLSMNDWYAITIDTVPRADSAQIIERLVREERIPEDSYCTTGSTLQFEIRVDK